MMKFFVAIILTALLAFAGSLFFDWWVIGVAGFLVGALITQKPFASFISGFLALFLLWGVHSLLIDQANNHLLAGKIAAVLMLGQSYIALIAVTASVGGLVGGLSSLTGSLFRRMIKA